MKPVFRGAEPGARRFPAPVRDGSPSVNSDLGGGRLMNDLKRTLCLILILALCLGACAPALGAGSGSADLKTAINGAAGWILSAVSDPGAGDYFWPVFSVARSGHPAEDSWYRSYLASVRNELAANGGALNTRRYSDYSKSVLAFTALGQQPPEELIRPLSNFEKVCSQGINGPVWALIALDSGGYEALADPAAKTVADRQTYVDELLSRQLEDGGWSLSAKGGSSPADTDITAMVLQALSAYQSQKAVREAIDRALTCMSKRQREDGGLGNFYGETCSESPAQMILALCALGLGPEDERFVKEGGSLVDAVLRFRQPDGSFLHVLGSNTGVLLATSQSLLALTAVQRYCGGESPLYVIQDPLKLSVSGLPGKDPAVTVMPVVQNGVSFPDLKGKACRDAVLGLAARNILNGFTDGTFKPEDPMTRAQFAKTAVTALGITASGTASFPDVAPKAWYSAAVATAVRFKIVNGREDGRFDPEANIDLQEAAAMVCRAAKLCGLDTTMGTAEGDKLLSAYGDRSKVQNWAVPTLAWCLKNGVVVRSGNLDPRAKMTRGEIAQMFWRLLELAQLR